MAKKKQQTQTADDRFSVRMVEITVRHEHDGDLHDARFAYGRHGDSSLVEALDAASQRLGAAAEAAGGTDAAAFVKDATLTAVIGVVSRLTEALNDRAAELEGVARIAAANRRKESAKKAAATRAAKKGGNAEPAAEPGAEDATAVAAASDKALKRAAKKAAAAQRRAES